MAKHLRQQPEDDADKRAAYPLYGLNRVLLVGKIVADLGGAKIAVQKSLIAQRMAVPETAALLSQSIGATKTFGVIAGHGTYRLTDLGARYFFPTNASEQRQALLAALKMPKVFESLINRFDGARVPAADVLVNILHRDHDVTESWRARVASLFLSSLKEAQLIDGSGFLRYRASLHAADAGKMPSTETLVQAPPAEEAPQTQVNQTQGRIVAGGTPENGRLPTTWIHQGVRVETPERLTMDLWKRLADYVNVLKPGGEQKENN